MEKRQEKRTFRRSWASPNPRAVKKNRVDEKLIVVLHRLPIAVVAKKKEPDGGDGMSLEMEIHTDIEGKVTD